MEKLDIERLHSEKTGRRSGRTTDMLANVVGIAQLAHATSHVMVVSTDAFRTYKDFIEVLRAIDPSAEYSRTICRGYPSAVVRSEYGAPCYVMFSERDVPHWANGMMNAYQVVDHRFLESIIELKKCEAESRRRMFDLGRIKWY